MELVWNYDFSMESLVQTFLLGFHPNPGFLESRVGKTII